jgi:hypothetical protein
VAYARHHAPRAGEFEPIENVNADALLAHHLVREDGRPLHGIPQVGPLDFVETLTVEVGADAEVVGHGADLGPCAVLEEPAGRLVVAMVHRRGHGLGPTGVPRVSRKRQIGACRESKAPVTPTVARLVRWNSLYVSASGLA